MKSLHILNHGAYCGLWYDGDRILLVTCIEALVLGIIMGLTSSWFHRMKQWLVTAKVYQSVTCLLLVRRYGVHAGRRHTLQTVRQCKGPGSDAMRVILHDPHMASEGVRSF